MIDLQRIRDLAYLSVGRACLFGLLAICAVTMGLITWPLVALRAAAFLATLAGVILAYKALEAPRRSYRRTEVWVLLGKPRGLPEARVQAAISGVMAETFWRFTTYAAAIAAAMWVVAFLAWAVRPAAG